MCSWLDSLIQKVSGMGHDTELTPSSLLLINRLCQLPMAARRSPKGRYPAQCCELCSLSARRSQTCSPMERRDQSRWASVVSNEFPTSSARHSKPLAVTLQVWTHVMQRKGTMFLLCCNAVLCMQTWPLPHTRRLLETCGGKSGAGAKPSPGRRKPETPTSAPAGWRQGSLKVAGT